MSGGIAHTDVTTPAGSHIVVRSLAAFPVACFCGALVTDAAYWWTTDMLWADFSTWLLAVGLAVGVLAAVAGVIDWLAHRGWRRAGSGGIVAAGSVVVLVLGLFDNLVHSRDAWTSVVPWGLALSAATVLAMLLTAWLSGRRRTLAYVPVTP